MVKLGRPRLPDNELKNPRVEKTRKSNYKGQQLDIPAPSEAELAKWVKIVEKCRVLVLTNASTHSGAKKNMIELRLSGIPPEGFPRGRVTQRHEDGSVTRRINAEQLLMWLWERKLAPWNAGMLYRMRNEVLHTWEATMSGVGFDTMLERELSGLL